VKPIIIHTKAREELDNSVGYYEEQKAGLGLDFLSEVEQSISKIQQNSNIGA
jgi:toxin ParE1/3/4